MRYALERGRLRRARRRQRRRRGGRPHGALAHVHAGESVDVSGDWRRHPRHGPQFAVERVRVREPTSEAAVLAYLNSIKHVGIRGAAWLVDRHGVERPRRRRPRPAPRVCARSRGSASGRSARRCARGRSRARCGRCGCSSRATASRPPPRRASTARSGPGAIEMLQTDPYATTEVEGIGFATADALARALGTPPDAPSRHRRRAAPRAPPGRGRRPLPPPARGGPRPRVAAARDRRRGPPRRARRLREARRGGRARLGPGDVRDRAAPGAPASASWPSRRPRCAGARATAERPVSGAFVPTDAQWEAVTNALEHRLSILTGLPGHGQDATMRALVDLLRDQRAQRAAVRAHRQGGAAAGRAHGRGGEDDPPAARVVPGEGFSRGAEDPIPGLDMLIVDEASMLSVRLADALSARSARGRTAARRRRRPARAGRAGPRPRGPHRVRPGPDRPRSPRSSARPRAR